MARGKKQGQPPRTPKGQPYGMAQMARRQQEIIPLPEGSAQPPPRPSSQQSPRLVAPAELGAFDRPTERPGEPLTAGAPVGPGPGPEVLGRGGGNPDGPLSMLRTIYRAFPYEEIRQLIEAADEDAYDRALAIPPAREA